MFKLFRRTLKLEDLDKKLVFSLRASRLPGLRQLKLLPQLLSRQERWIVRGAVALLLLGLAILLTPRIAKRIVPIPRAGGTYTEALVGAPRLINPILAATDLDRDLVHLIYSGLLRYNGKGELEGDLAQSWQISPDGLHLAFKLKPNLRFQSGETISAEDVRFTIEAIKNPAWRSPLWRSFQDLTVETPDQNTVNVNFKATSASAVQLFTVGIVPKYLWEDVDPAVADRAVWNVKPVGSGPFQFKGLTKSADGTLISYALARNENYPGDAPYLSKIVLRFFTDFESALAALREHRVDGVSFTPLRLRKSIPTQGFTLRKVTLRQFTGVFFQDRKNEILKERAVRAALALAVNRKEIADALQAVQEAATPFLKGDIGFARTVRQPAFDLAGAESLLKEAGWKKEEGEGKARWIKKGETLKIALTTLDEPTLLKVAELIKTSWDRLGVEATVEAVPHPSFEREVLKGRAFEALLYSIVGGADPDPYAFWHSSQIDDPGVNLSSIKSRALDAALEQGRSTLDRTTRFLSYIEFQNNFLDEVPAIILYSSPYLYVTSDHIRGITLERIASPADRFNGIEHWYRRWRPGWR